MRFFVLVIFFFSFVFSANIEHLRWIQGETFLTFLEKYKIPADAYFQLSKTDKELCSEITAGSKFELLYDAKNPLIQALIPINEELQIHIKKLNNNFVIDFIPISYFEKTETLAFKLSKSPYEDIVNLTNNEMLASDFVKNFKSLFDFKQMKTGDVIKIKYRQRVRGGMFFGSPEIDGVFIESGGKKNFLVKQDGLIFDTKGKVLERFFMHTPISYKKITSRFTLKRFHPVLKIYRAHLGVDYSANVGTKVFAAADGKVIFRGIKGGYGKTVTIVHKNGYKTLYGHLSSYPKTLRIGQTVKQGDLVAFSGNSGVSSGPHLHFGVYKNEHPVDPLGIIKAAKEKFIAKRQEKAKEMSSIARVEIEKVQVLNVSSLKLENFDLKSTLVKAKEIK